MAKQYPTPFDCEKTLNPGDVIAIHDYVVDFFADEDPIYPGVRSEDLLHSAVLRPLVGCPRRPKYRDVHLAIATLTFGLTKNHPFNDGNKRTAVISMLAFLDLWKMQLVAEVKHNDLYELMIALTEDRLHSFVRNSRTKVPIDLDSYYVIARETLQLPRTRAELRSVLKSKKLGGQADFSVYLLARWLQRYTRKRDNRDRKVTLRELKQILQKFNMFSRKVDGTTYEIVRTLKEEKRAWLRLKRKEQTREEVCYRLHVGGKNRLIGIDQIKGLRRSCGLTNYDYHAFYGDRTPADYFLLEHARVLRKLSKYDKGDV